MIVKRANFALSLYLLSALGFFVLVGLPALDGRLDFQYYFDSATYHTMAEQAEVGWNLVQIGGNYLGPLLVIKLLNSSYTLIFLFYALLFTAGYLIATHSIPVRRMRFLALLMASPLVFVSLFAVNKDAIAVFVTLLFVSSYAADRPLWRWLAVALSITARWQMSVALGAAIFMMGPLNPFRRRRLLSIVCLLAGLSVFYPINLSTFDVVDQIAREASQFDTQGSGLYYRLIDIQNHVGGYLVAFAPKALHLFVGQTRRWYKLLDFSDVGNNVTLWLQSLLQLAVLVRLFWLRRLRLSSDAVYLGVILAAVLALSPVYTTRYLLPVYVLLALELSMPRAGPPEQVPPPSTATGP